MCVPLFKVSSSRTKVLPVICELAFPGHTRCFCFSCLLIDYSLFYYRPLCMILRDLPGLKMVPSG